MAYQGSKVSAASKSRTSKPPLTYPPTMARPYVADANQRRNATSVGRLLWKAFHETTGRLVPSAAMGMTETPAATRRRASAYTLLIAEAFALDGCVDSPDEPT